jgi:WD40 repeat protein
MRVGIVVGLVIYAAAWLFTTRTVAAQRVIPGEPEVRVQKKMFTSDITLVWTGPQTWDVEFLGSPTLLATAGPWNPMTFHDLNGAPPARRDGDRGAGAIRHAPEGLAWPYAFSPDGRTLAADVGGSVRSVRIWEVPSGQELGTVNLDDNPLVLQLAFSSDGKRLAVGWLGFSKRGKDCCGMTIVSASTGKMQSSVRIDDLPLDGHIHLLAVSADCEAVAINRRPDTLELWGARAARVRATITTPTNPGPFATSNWVFGPGGSVLAGRLADGTVGLWDTNTGRCRIRDGAPVLGRFDTRVRGGNWMRWPQPTPRPFAVSRDGTLLAVGCPGGAVHLWDIASAREQPGLPPSVPPLEEYGPIQFSDDGRILAVAGEGPTTAPNDRLPAAVSGVLRRERDAEARESAARVIVWDLAARRQCLAASAHGRFSAVTVAPDGSAVAAAREEEIFDEGWPPSGKTVRDVLLWSTAQ